MRTLTYDGAVFDEGNGWIYRKIMNWTLPGLFLAAVEIGVINAGLLQALGVPSFVLKPRCADGGLCHSVGLRFSDLLVFVNRQEQAL